MMRSNWSTASKNSGDLLCRQSLSAGYAPPKCGEVALPLHPLLMGLGEEEVAAVMEERTLIEVSFRGSGEKVRYSPPCLLVNSCW